jgi:hypothetical protein
VTDRNPTDFQLPAYLQRRKAYAEDFDKTILPTIQVGQTYIESQTVFAKLAISYLFLANGGGLAAILAVQPLLRDVNQTWLQQAVWIGSIFGGGLFCAAVCAALFYLNHSQNAAAISAKYRVLKFIRALYVRILNQSWSIVFIN